MSEEDKMVGLDPDWLRSALRDGPGEPEQVKFEGFVGTGQMSRNARFALEWSTEREPTSIVVKLPSAEAETRTLAFAQNAYLKECDFYRSALPNLDVAAPAPLFVHYDAENADFAIVLEDLRDYEQGDQFKEPTTREIGLAIDQAAALHASGWNQRDKPAFSTLVDDADACGSRADGLSRAAFPVVMDRLRDRLEPGMPELVERFVELADPWARLCCGSDHPTFVHQDFRPDNFMFATGNSPRPLVIVDWQSVAFRLGAIDISYLIGGAYDVKHRREVEDTLIERYVEELGRRGVSYSMDTCRADYAIGTLHGFFTGIIATYGAARTERGDALFAQMINRHGRHAAELQALEIVEQATKNTGG